MFHLDKKVACNSVWVDVIQCSQCSPSNLQLLLDKMILFLLLKSFILISIHDSGISEALEEKYWKVIEGTIDEEDVICYRVDMIWWYVQSRTKYLEQNREIQ